ncbi:hypothetical protein [Pseudoteredinibacter isoporae]|uniref:DUF1311 domain-containing protein n=1 Tax=Pseudoteredinibacter isoporae TaxID=570281 RepID=A0A7X0MXD5_9GAMM|nr:hypothetical protein [Pseudoteredinibacter isoporae]MBB6523368.1 hypothetical protein [Pseudoteredinibacter isoporae]NHO88880.1 hypothetical protein [Pseudoteredinibacter isoporae]NIB24412.1 hypothetical protein [Pseudoteredinibacter isoporae]
MSAQLRTALSLLQAGIFLALLNMPMAQAQDVQQCEKINCRCDGLWSTWGQACSEQENQLREQCVQNEGKISNYCRWQGQGAYPSVLGTLKPAKNFSAEQLEQARTAFQSKLWSMQQDFTSSQELYGQGDSKSAAALAKRVDRQADSAISQGLVLLAIHRQLEDEEARTAALAELRGALSDQENRFLAWSAAMGEQNNMKLSRRFSRYSGNQAEFQALLFDALGDFDSASRAWQRAANRAEQLMEASKKPRIWKFYRAQAASRYAKAATSERSLNGSGQGLAQQADDLWALSLPTPATPE